jgi:hypothetical protein
MHRSAFALVATALPLALLVPSLPAAAQTGATAYVTFAQPDGHLYRADADQIWPLEDVSLSLDALAPGLSDQWLNTSPDGAFLLLSSDRFDPRCAGWECLARVAADLSSGGALLVDGEPVHAGGFSAIASGGQLVVYMDGFDLWAIRETDAGWSPPLLLTGASPYEYNAQPALSADAATVVFDCGPVPYGQAGTALCEVGTDGEGLRLVASPSQVPGATALHHPDYAPDGSIVFEADAGGEQLWRLAPGATAAQLVAAGFNNDNSPCVLADGRIASLWLERPGSAGQHELKLLSADATAYAMLLVGQDIADVGIGCGAVPRDPETQP